MNAALATLVALGVAANGGAPGAQPLPRQARLVPRGLGATTLGVVDGAGQHVYARTLSGRLLASHDAGATWHDATGAEAKPVVCQEGRGTFYAGAPFSIFDVYGGHRMLHTDDLMGTSLRDTVTSPYYGTDGDSYLDYDPDSPAFWGALNIRLTDSGYTGGFGFSWGLSIPSIGWFGVQDDGGGALGNSSSCEPQGFRLVPPAERPSPTAVLAQRGAAGVGGFAVDPAEPSHAVAYGPAGTLVTVDGGLSWRMARLAPATAALFLGESLLVFEDAGVQVSTDLGRTFAPIPDSPGGVVSAVVDAEGKRLVVATAKEVLRTGPRARRFAMVSAVPGVRHLSMDASGRLIAIARDGTWLSGEGNGPWRKLNQAPAGLRRVVPSPSAADRWVGLTQAVVWETDDAGQSWTAVYDTRGDDELVGVRFDATQGALGPYTIATTGDWVRVSVATPAPRRSRSHVSLDTQGHAELAKALEASFERLGLSDDYQRRASMAAWLPRVSAAAGYMYLPAVGRLDGPANYDDIGFRDYGAQGPGGFVFRVDHSEQVAYGMVFLTWDLDKIVYRADELESDGRFRQVVSEHYRVASEVRELYQERHHLMQQWSTERPAGVWEQLSLQLRLEEVTAHLEHLTGQTWQHGLAFDSP